MGLILTVSSICSASAQMLAIIRVRQLPPGREREEGEGEAKMEGLGKIHVVTLQIYPSVMSIGTHRGNL